MENEPFFHSATGVSLLSYTPLSGLHWKPARQSSRKGLKLVFGRSPAGTAPRHFGLFPPFGRASIDRRQRLRFGLRSSGTALHFLLFRAFRWPLARPLQGTGAGYPRRFSPMRAFRQLHLPKADASQNGFHPAYALSCQMAWRNSFLLCGFQDAQEIWFSPCRREGFPFPCRHAQDTAK